MNKTGVIAKISIKYVLPTCIWKYFWRISRYFAFFWEFRGISRKYLNFAGPRPREISEALKSVADRGSWTERQGERCQALPVATNQNNNLAAARVNFK